METPVADAPEAPAGSPGPRPGRLAPSRPRQTGVDRFDEAIVVTRARAWIGLAACLVLVAGIVVWGTTATIDQTVSAPGAALVNGTLTEVASPVSGTVVKLAIRSDKPVHAGQTIAVVALASHRRLPLTAPIPGRILSLGVSAGSTVHPGDEVAALTPMGGPLVVRLFLEPSEAQRVARGMAALLTMPSGATVHGHVARVGTLPLTQQEIADSIGSQALAADIAPDSGLVGVLVKLFRHPPQVIGPGDVAAVSIIAGKQHPISYVF